MAKLLDVLKQISVIGVVFFIPLAFSPFTFEAFEFNKLFLLFFLVLLGLLSWFSKMVFVDKEIRVRKTPLDVPLLVFLGIVILSSLFSADRWSSLFGYYGRFSDSLLSVLSFGGLYFLITNTENVKPRFFLNVFLFSVSIALFFAYLSFFGVLAKLSFLPSLMHQQSFNPVSGSLEGFAILVSVIVVFLAAFSFRMFAFLLFLASLVFLLFLDFDRAWIVVLLGVLFALFLSLSQGLRAKERTRARPVFLLLFVLLLSIVFLFSPTKIPGIAQNPVQEPLLSQEFSWDIAFNTAFNGIKEALLGSGQGTFALDFSQQRPADFNTLAQWQARFERAGNHIAEVLSTAGFLGLLSYLSLFALFFFVSWVFLQRKEAFLFFLLASLLFLSQFLYYQTLTLGMSFWLFLALGACCWDRAKQDFVFSLRKFPEFEIGAKALLLVFFLFFLGLCFFGTRLYLADANYLQSQTTQRSNLTERIAKAENATRLNPWQGEYKIFVSRLYLQRALRELEKQESNQDKDQISQDVQRAIANARGDVIQNQRIKGAVELAPRRVASWEALGALYRDISFATGALEWSLRSFERATTLEPTNPALATELGKLYLKKEDFPKARKELEKAVELKPDFLEAQRQLALLSEKEGDLDLAISLMQELSLRYPSDWESAFQLGRLYYNNGDNEKAILQFKAVLEVSPNHSNALFALGIALEQQGKTKEARETLEKVLLLNPGNEAVQKKLQELKE